MVRRKLGFDKGNVKEEDVRKMEQFRKCAFCCWTRSTVIRTKTDRDRIGYRIGVGESNDASIVAAQLISKSVTTIMAPGCDGHIKLITTIGEILYTLLP